MLCLTNYSACINPSSLVGMPCPCRILSTYQSTLIQKGSKIYGCAVMPLQIAATIERDHRIADLLETEGQGAVNSMLAELTRGHVRQAVRQLVTQVASLNMNTS